MQNLWVTWDSRTWKSWNEYFDVFCIVLSLLSCLLSFGFVICQFLSSGCVMFLYVFKLVCNFCVPQMPGSKKTGNWKNDRKITEQWPKTGAKVRFFRHLQALPQMPSCKENETWMTENNKTRQPQNDKKWYMTENDKKNDKRQWQKTVFLWHLLVSNCYCKTIDLARAALSVTIRCWCFV